MQTNPKRDHLVLLVGNIPNVVDVQPVEWMWSCFNCGELFDVGQRSFQLLERKQLLGVRCPDCLNPPADSGLLRVA